MKRPGIAKVFNPQPKRYEPRIPTATGRGPGHRWAVATTAHLQHK